MDSSRAYGSIRREPEGMAIRSGSVLASSQERTASTFRDDNRGGKMTTIKLFIASGLIAAAAHAVLPEIPAKPVDCEPVIECTQKEPIE